MAGAAERREAGPGTWLGRLAAVTLVVPALVFEQWPTTYAAVVGFASGPVGAWLGQSAKSFGSTTSPDTTGTASWIGMAREALIALATLLFAATLFSCWAGSAPSLSNGWIAHGWSVPG